MGMSRRPLALLGGALVLLTAVSVGLVRASSVTLAIAPAAVDAAIAPERAATAAQEQLAATAAVTDQPDILAAAAFRLRGRGAIVHGTVTIDSPKDGLIIVQVDGGTIAAVDADSLMIAEKGGASVTVAIDTETRVRRDRKRATVADLKVGDTIRVVSRVAAGGGATAKAIVVTPAAGG
jgi:hypothetical protein